MAAEPPGVFWWVSCDTCPGEFVLVEQDVPAAAKKYDNVRVFQVLLPKGSYSEMEIVPAEPAKIKVKPK